MQPKLDQEELQIPLRVRIEDFIYRLRSKRPTPAAVHSLVRKEVETLRRDYAPSSLPMCFSDYRLSILAKFGEHPAATMLLSVPKARAAGLPLKYCCGFTSAEIGGAKRRVRNRVMAYQHAQLPIESPSSMLVTALQTLLDPGRIAKGPLEGAYRWNYLLVALVFLTGRRPIELALTGKLSPATHSDQFTLIFDGQAKTRGAIGTRQGPYPIRVLAPAPLVLKAWKRLRQSLPDFGGSGDVFHNKTAKPTFEAVTVLFPGFKAYDLRAVNGRLTYHLFSPANKTDLAWFQDQFGHTDTITSAFYQRYYLPKPTGWKRAFFKLFASVSPKSKRH